MHPLQGLGGVSMFKKIALVIILITIIGLGDYYLVDVLSTKKIDLVPVFVAATTIQPRSIITEKDIKEIYVPSAYVLADAINNKHQIIGKITNIQGMIPKNSLFYASQLDNLYEIPDAAVPLLEPQEIAYVLSVNQSDNNFDTFTVGQRVDVYGSITPKNKLPIFDCVLESVRIVSIKDRKGIEVTATTSIGSIQTLTIAIHKDQLQILVLISNLGKIELYASTNKKGETIFNDESEVVEYLQTLK